MQVGVPPNMKRILKRLITSWWNPLLVLFSAVGLLSAGYLDGRHPAGQSAGAGLLVLASGGVLTFLFVTTMLSLLWWPSPRFHLRLCALFAVLVVAVCPLQSVGWARGFKTAISSAGGYQAIAEDLHEVARSMDSLSFAGPLKRGFVDPALVNQHPSLRDLNCSVHYDLDSGGKGKLRLTLDFSRRMLSFRRDQESGDWILEELSREAPSGVVARVPGE